MSGILWQKRNFVCFLCFLAITAKTAQAVGTVYFADPYLKAAVEEKLGISEPNATDMLALTELDAGGKGIIYLKGIEYASNLTKLSLTGNWISDISPVSGLTKLTRLRLDETRISDISPISGLTNLTELDLNNTHTSDVSAISGLKNLTNLCLFNNQISDIQALSNLINLKELYLHYNQIRDISAISGLKNLTTLYLNDNQITDISVISELTKLNELGLDNNQIADITALSSIKDLTRLSLTNNNIIDISAVAGLKNLRSLYLSHNQITDVSPVCELENLTWLALNYNQHNDISFGSGLTNLSLIEMLDKNAQLWGDPNIENSRKIKHWNFGGLIAQNVTEHLEYIINKPGGFEKLKSIINQNFQDYPENPKGKYYSNNGLGAYFIIHDSIIAYFFSGYDKAHDWTGYSNIVFLCPGSQCAQYASSPSYSLPNVDIFEVDANLYVFAWAAIPATEGFSEFTLSTIKNGEISLLEKHGIVGIIDSYDFDNRVLYTAEHREQIKQEWIHGNRATYDVAYLIDDKIQKFCEECANPWYLVLKYYLEAIWERDIVKAKQFVLDEEVLERTRNYRYCDPDIHIQSVEDLDLYGENIKKEIKTVYLHYEHMGKKKWVSTFEAFDLKEYDGEWKIIDIHE